MEPTEFSRLFNPQSLLAASDFVWKSKYYQRTPVLTDVEAFFNCFGDPSTKLCLKLESAQTFGCFKTRGVAHQLHRLYETNATRLKQNGLVTFSAGNYGITLASIAADMGIPATIVMPETAPVNRRTAIEALGARVVPVPTPKLMETLQKIARDENRFLVHPFDDVFLVQAYASVGFEILEQVPDVDVVLIPCGGGGLVAGAALGIKTSPGLRKPVKVYAVEPDGANTMYRSFQLGAVAKLPEAKSVASGLAPPEAGVVTYDVCRKFVDDVLLVSDEEILAAVRKLKSLGLVVEPSGAAALAAVMSKKIGGELKGATVVAVISGRNITLENWDSI